MMFPNDSILTIERVESPTVRTKKTKTRLDVGYMGIAGWIDAEATAHFLDMDNPHGDNLGNVRSAPGEADLWPFVDTDGKVGLHTRPLYYEDIKWPENTDSRVKTDAGDPAAGYLEDKIAGRALTIYGRRLCLTEDSDDMGKRLYFGTDAAGRLGWHPCQWGAVTRRASSRANH
ncbi:MAG: hypothetical protein LBR71_06690 [Synergistaceae bacterium]|jgi:hypothetical protein|nr:hypothetical protein [Synergistaceae bacterium]